MELTVIKEHITAQISTLEGLMRSVGAWDHEIYSCLSCAREAYDEALYVVEHRGVSVEDREAKVREILSGLQYALDVPHLISQLTQGRTTSLDVLSEQDYHLLLQSLYRRKRLQDDRVRYRSIALKALKQYGVPLQRREEVDDFLMGFMGQVFGNLSIEDLYFLTDKLHTRIAQGRRYEKNI